MKIRFHGDFPTRYREEIEDVLSALSLFLSPFVLSIRVYFEQGGEGEASINVLRRYNCANLNLNSLFFTISEEERREVLAHEVSHVLVDPIAKEATDVLEYFFEDMETAHYIEAKLDDAVEKTVDSIGLALSQVLTRRVDTRDLREGDTHSEREEE